LPTPITVHLLTDTSTLALQFAQFIQAAEAPVGFKVVIDSYDAGTARTLTLNGNWDTKVVTSSFNDPDPQNILYNILGSGSANAIGYSNPRLDYVLGNGLKASSVSARATNYKVAQQIIHDDRPIIVLYDGFNFIPYDASLLTGVAVNALGQATFVNAQYK
jgi:ABC-type transport system substrate-binding protein